MKLKNKLIISFASAILLSSCVTGIPMTITQIGAFEKGETKSEFLNYVTNKPIINPQIETTLSKSKANVYVYYELVSSSYLDYIVCIFIDDKLNTWGKIDDLKKHPNKEIQNIANQTSKLIKENN
jgi:hypothetical protein